VLLTRRLSLFLALAGLFNVAVWPRFAVAVWNDPRAFAGSSPTPFLWVHAVLIVSATLIGLGVLGIGVRGWSSSRTARREHADHR
jgi:hypothetical protein